MSLERFASDKNILWVPEPFHVRFMVSVGFRFRSSLYCDLLVAWEADPKYSATREKRKPLVCQVEQRLATFVI